MSLFDFFKRRPKPAAGESRLPPNPDAEALLDIMKMMRDMNPDGIDADRFPHGVGEFGSLDNPVPCDSILGAMGYLARLRWNGQPVRNERLGSYGSKVIERPIDGYRLTAPDGRELTTLYISPYQKKNSTLAPQGYTLDR